MNIKRLNLEGWMKSKLGFDFTIKHSSANYTPIDPIIGKNGIYLKGKYCWFEIDGKAYTSSKIDFKFTFDILKMRELSKKKVEALQAIVDAKIATKAQKDLYNLYSIYGTHFDLNDARRKKRLKEIKRKIKDKNQK